MRLSTDDLAAGTAVCALAATLIALAAAVTVRVSGTGDDVRGALNFGFGGVERTPAEALRIAGHNGRLVAATLLCTIARPRLSRPLTRLADLTLAAVLAVNAAVVGTALGVYGSRMASAVALHLPVEFAALSLAGGTYLEARRRPPNTQAVLLVGALCATLLLGAAALETYAPLGGVW